MFVKRKKQDCLRIRVLKLNAIKRAKIAMESASNSIQDSMTNEEEAEDNNMRLVEALDLSLPLNSNNAQTSTDFCPIKFKSVSDLTLHMASFSLWEIPRHLSRERRCMRTHKLFPSSRDFCHLFDYLNIGVYIELKRALLLNS